MMNSIFISLWLRARGKYAIYMAFILWGLASNGKAQTFNRSIDFNGEVEGCTSVIQLDSLILFGSGSFSDIQQEGFRISICDSTGNTVNNKSYGRTNHVWYAPNGGVVETQEGDFILGGGDIENAMGSNWRPFVVRFNSKGDTLWTRVYPSNKDCQLQAGAQTPDSGFAFAGTKTTHINGSTDVYLMRIDKSGNLLWEKSYDNGAKDRAKSILLMPDGGFLISALHKWTNYNAWVIRTDAQGNLLWSKTYGTIYDDPCGGFISARIGIGVSSGYYVGQCMDTLSGPEKTLRVVACLPEGGILWSRILTIGDLFLDQWNQKTLADGSVLLMGYSSPYYGSPDAGWITKISPSGDIRWSRHYRYRPDASGIFYDATELPNGDLVMAGTTAFNGIENGNFWVMRLDAAGCLTPGCDLLSDADVQLQEVDIEVWPNPASDVLNLRIKTPEAIELTLFDLSGRELRKANKAEGAEIAWSWTLEGLAPGIYLLTARGKQGIWSTRVRIE